MQPPRLMLFLLAALFPFLSGCKQEETVDSYEVPYRERDKLNLRVAILPQGEDVWFVRVSGPEQPMQQHGKAFEDFVRSIRFKEKEEPPISWDEPKAWTKDPPHKDRHASYKIDVKPKPLEVKITKFPRDKFQLLANVNRWQKELNLPVSDAHEVDPFVKREKLRAKPDDQEVTWVELTGYGVHRISKPMEVAAHAPMKEPMLAGGLGATPFKYTVPKGWVEKPPRDQFTAVLFELTRDGQTVNVTLTALGGDGGGLASNVSRWRKQVGLPDSADQQLMNSLVPLKVAGASGHYVDISNPDGPAKLNRILAVVVPYQGKVWFVRMSGTAGVVGQNKADFETFVKSFELNSK